MSYYAIVRVDFPDCTKAAAERAATTIQHELNATRAGNVQVLLVGQDQVWHHHGETPNARWDNNELQFARLIDEIVAALDIDVIDRDNICSSMDLEPEELDELFERAQARWDRAKGEV